jgi:phospholipase C
MNLCLGVVIFIVDNSAMPNRRDFLQQLAALAGGAAGMGSLLASVERAYAIDPPAGSTFLDAEHVVILMQENRSFDHMYGALRGVRGFNDPRAVTLPDQKSVWFQSNAKGETYAPFHLDIQATKATWLGSLPHSWRDQTDARNFGNHDRWLDAKPSNRKECEGMPFTMGYYDRGDLPFYYALADAFTVCDQHFCSSLTGTTPNRLYLWTGTIREAAGAKANVRNSDVDYDSTARWKTFPERLEDANIPWRVYQNELSVASGLEGEHDAWLANFTDNPLEWFDQYHVGLRATALKRESGAGVSARERSLHAKAFTTNEGDPDYRQLTTLRYRDNGVERELVIPKGDPFFRFRKDVEDGALPAVSWLVPSEHFSDHPGSAWYGAWYVAEAMNILTKNPDLWRKTIFILTYDENDGYFDHVPPFVAPEPGKAESGRTSSDIDAHDEYWPLDQDSKQQEAKNARGGPIGLGYRVPMVIASPWSRGGFVCSQVFDHTSVVQLLERWLTHRYKMTIRETNISTWRRAVCGDLSAAFRTFDTSAAELPFPERDRFLQQIHEAQFAPMPTGFQNAKVPEQEPGVRPSTALGYELAVTGAVSRDGQRFEMELEASKRTFGDAAIGAPFHVYTPGAFRGRTDLRTRAYAVSAGQRVADSWDLRGFDDNTYHVCACGPNGFLREFRGTATEPGVEVQCEYVRKGRTLTGDLALRVTNRSKTRLTVHVGDHGYKIGDNSLTLAPGSSRKLMLSLALSYGWYDFSVTLADANQRFLRRFAGRVETGKQSFSDPVMGRG